MAFPSGNGSIQSLDVALRELQSVAAAARSSAERVRSRALADNSCRAVDLIDYVAAQAAYRDRMQAYASVVGLAAYAQAQYSNVGFDIVTQYNAMTAAIDASRSWITTNFPKAAGGELLERAFDANGRTVQRTFTAAQLAALVTLLDAVVASID